MATRGMLECGIHLVLSTRTGVDGLCEGVLEGSNKVRESMDEGILGLLWLRKLRAPVSAMCSFSFQGRLIRVICSHNLRHRPPNLNRSTSKIRTYRTRC